MGNILNHQWFPGDELFSDAEQRFRTDLRAWLHDNPPPPRPRNLDRDWIRGYARWHASMVKAGFAGLSWPKEYGGLQLGIGYQLVQVEELARMDIDPKILMAGLTLAGPLLMNVGTAEQRAQHLDAILYGRSVWCMLLSEPEAGSDLGSVKTRGVMKSDGLHVSGQKTWSSRAHISDYGMTLIRTSDPPNGSRGLTMVVIDLASPGISMTPLEQLTGQQEFNEVFFDDVVVPEQNIVGGLDRGWAALMTSLTSERNGMSLGGYAQLVRSLQVLSERGMTSGGAQKKDAYIRVWSAIAAQRLTALRSASATRKPEEALAFASASKLQYGRNAQALADYAANSEGLRSIAVDGGWDDLPWSTKQFLRSPAESIGGGTNEIQKNAIADRVLKMPRA